MKHGTKIVQITMTATAILTFAAGCGMLVEKTIDKDSYYSYVGERPDVLVTSRKYEAAQGIMQASSANYSKILKHLDQYLTLTKDKHQYIGFIHTNINLPPAMAAEKLLALRNVNPAAFTEISQVFQVLKMQLPTAAITREYSNACLLKNEIGRLKVGMEADMLNKKQVISDLTYQNNYAVSAAEFLNKQCILANAPEMREVIRIIQKGN